MGSPQGSIVPSSDLGVACCWEQLRSAYFRGYGLTDKADKCLVLAERYGERLQDVAGGKTNA